MVQINKRSLIVGIGIVAVVAIVAVTCAVVLTREKACKTPACKEAGNALSRYMNGNADPCNDFYDFACGRINLPRGELTYGPFSSATLDLYKNVIDILKKHVASGRSGSAADQAAQLHKRCVSSTGSRNTDIISLLKDVTNGFPLIPSTMSSPSTSFSWSQTVAKVLRNWDQDFVLSLHVLPHPKNTSQSVIGLYPENAQLTRPAGSIIRPPQRTNPIEYSSDLTIRIKTIICEIDGYCYSNKNLERDIRTLIENFFTNSEYSQFQEDMSYLKDGFPYKLKAPNGEDMTPQALTVSQLTSRIPSVNWREFFTTVFENTEYSVREDTVVVTSVGFLNSLITNFLDKHTPRNMAIYLGWKLIEKLGPVFNERIRYYLDRETREQTCMQLTQRVMGFAVGHLYHKKFVTDETLNEATKIIQDLKQAFEDLLSENSWMDEKTKQGALLKVNNLVESVSTPEWARNEEGLDKYYEKIASVSTVDFASSLKTFLSFDVEKKAVILKEPLDRRNSWPVKTSAETNAFYYQNINAMFFPSGILVYPFFVQGRPRSMNYGAFGYIAGHEITHGFDDTGSHRGVNGTVYNWWTKPSKDHFESKAKCFVNQYGKIFDITAGQSLNGEKTLGENIADNGGVRQAYRAFKSRQKENNEDLRLPGLSKYNQDQLFFLSTAHMYCSKSTREYLRYQIKTDEHSPNEYRIRIPFQNSEDFAKAFNCPYSSKMNPPDKCQIW